MGCVPSKPEDTAESHGSSDKRLIKEKNKGRLQPGLSSSLSQFELDKLPKETFTAGPPKRVRKREMSALSWEGEQDSFFPAILRMRRKRTRDEFVAGLSFGASPTE